MGTSIDGLNARDGMDSKKIVESRESRDRLVVLSVPSHYDHDLRSYSSFFAGLILSDPGLRRLVCGQ